MKVEEPVDGYPVRIPVAPEVARRAQELVRQFPGCFWFWREDPPMACTRDVAAVICHLRNYGGKSAWQAARELKERLQPLSRIKS